MELRQLEHFVAVADEGSFTRAARRVHIVQSALSTSIRSLESELGAQLFARSTRRVQMTTAGRAFYDHAKTVLGSVRAAREAVAAVQGIEQGSLVIGVVQSIGPFVALADLLGAFRADHPGIEMRVYQGGATLLIEDVRQGRLDLAIAPMSHALEGVVTSFIACEALVLACAADHPLAGQRDIPLARLAGEPFVDFPRGFGTRYLVDQGFQTAHLERRTTFEVSDLATMLDLVARGAGVALLPEPLIAAHEGAGDLLSPGVGWLAAPEICWELVAAYAGSDPAGMPGNPAARAFLELLQSRAQGGGGAPVPAQPDEPLPAVTAPKTAQ